MSLQSFALAPKPGHVPEDCVVRFDLYNPPDVGPDLHAAWKKLQDDNRHEIAWTPCNGGHWIALRGKALTDIYNDPETFSNKIILVPREIGEMHKMIPTTLAPTRGSTAENSKSLPSNPTFGVSLRGSLSIASHAA